MAVKPKKEKVLKGSHKASPLAAEALRQLLKTQAQAAILKARMKNLRNLIMREGGGTAHDHRMYVSHVKASIHYRTVTVKAHDILKIVPIPEGSKKTTAKA